MEANEPTKVMTEGETSKAYIYFDLKRKKYIIRTRVFSEPDTKQKFTVKT